MSAAGPGENKPNGTDKEKENDGTDYTIAKAAGAVIATGIAWSVFKTFWPKKYEEDSEALSHRYSSFESGVQDKSERFKEKASNFTKKFPNFSRKSKFGHEVSIGDTLYAISAKYGVSVEALKSANDLPDDLIVVGEKLNIPS